MHERLAGNPLDREPEVTHRLARPPEPHEQVTDLDEDRGILGTKRVFLEQEGQARLGIAFAGHRPRETGPKPRGVGLEPQRLAEAPRGAGVLAAVEPAFAHRHEAAGHPVEELLGLEVGQVGFLVATEFGEGDDASGPRGLERAVEGEAAVEERQGFLETARPARGGTGGELGLGPAGKQSRGLAEGVERLVDEIETVEGEAEVEAEVAAIGLAVDCLAELLGRLREASVTEVPHAPSRVRVAGSSRAGIRWVAVVGHRSVLKDLAASFASGRDRERAARVPCPRPSEGDHPA